VSLYQRDTRSYIQATQSIYSCSHIREELVPIATTADIPADFFIDDGMIGVDPAIYMNVGSYRLMIRACVDIYDYHRDMIDSICNDSDEFTVQVTDPCGDENAILSAPITAFMRKPQLQSDFISMPIEQGVYWPWTDAVDAAIPNDLYGYGLCGLVEYTITDMYDQSTDLVFYDPFTARIYFEPNLSHAPGIYEFKFKARLEKYSWIQTSVKFQVEVLQCQTYIYSDGVSFPSVENLWFESPRSLPLAPFLDGYYQEPACGYSMDYKVSLLVG
jgi:hypothetical protein